jgi:hypothetical protein
MYYTAYSIFFFYRVTLKINVIPYNAIRYTQGLVVQFYAFSASDSNGGGWQTRRHDRFTPPVFTLLEAG